MIAARAVKPSDRRTLRTINTYRLRRVKHGWQCAGSPLVRKATMDKMLSRGFVVIRTLNNRALPELTMIGLAVMEHGGRS